MSATDRKYFGTGRIHMPGNMMTKAGKRMQMVKDNQRESPRRGRPRPTFKRKIRKRRTR